MFLITVHHLFRCEGYQTFTFCNKKVFYVHFYAFSSDGTDVVDCVADLVGQLNVLQTEK